jgi:hypothetical protein
MLRYLIDWLLCNDRETPKTIIDPRRYERATLSAKDRDAYLWVNKAPAHHD